MSRGSAAQKKQTSDTEHSGEPATDKNAIRAFHLVVPDSELAGLPRPINEPERETVTDESQYAQLATIEELPRYWVVDDDWRMREAKLNALPQSMTVIDGLDILLIVCVAFLIVRMI
jgi:hypothetical protein